ncbi:MAG: Flp pilus assembly complex ATPase component TadA [Phycisphaeraceae bacterium]|nr:Flp pilus assembly complex ATPase component TadA [Phycisphaerales bacterium]QOJ18927.1 MAG: Flp pilus assembly complex ATPase component TadA [Phycisphaeraceae bacterium]
MARKRQKLGDILTSWKVVTAEQVQQAIQISQRTGKRLGEALIEAGHCSEEDVAKGLAAQFDMEFLNLDRPEASGRVDRSLIPEDLIKKHLVLPLGKENGRLRLLIHDPMDLELLDLLRFRLNTEIDTAIASKRQIKQYIDGGGSGEGGKGMFSEESLVTDSVDVTMDRSVDTSVDASIDIEAGADAPIIRLVNRMITEAVRSRASDIHVEPMEDRVLLRYRIDGVCHVRDNLPKRMQAALLARLKLMAGVNIAERRVPQDGRIKMPVDGEAVDFRVSCCPAYHGESVVLRILRSDSVRIGLINLGFEQDTLDEFNRIIRRPNGIFLVTGPTGSGKTTTLYSALDILNRPDRKIITAEDPIEYHFNGINQCQVRENIGLTFPIILRAMLRQAPNIILVGEIRDYDVAEVAIQAALTGHLVFSTLHTNDAPSAITRLIDMGVKPYLAASSVQAIMAQRLVRILCPQCKTLESNPDPKYMRLIGISPEEAAKGQIMKPVGCANCVKTGFRGRKGIFELMRMNQEIRELAFERAPIGRIRAAAIRAGMRTLVQDGKIKALKGATTMQEVATFAQADTLETVEPIA